MIGAGVVIQQRDERMAGSSTNWYKSGAKGASVKGHVYIAPAILIARLDGLAKQLGVKEITISEVKAALHAVADMGIKEKLVELLGKISESQQPGGQAKAKLPPSPVSADKTAVDGGEKNPVAPDPSWASDPASQAVRSAQENGLMRYRSDAEKALIDLIKQANPALQSFAGSVKTEEMPAAYKSLKGYQGNGYEARNTKMWSLTRADNGAIAGATPSSKSLLKLVHSMVSPVDMTVYRRVLNYHPLTAWAQDAAVGSSYTNLGFDSSSTNPQNWSYRNGVEMRMRIPKGSRGASMVAVFPDGKNSHESEWLIPANSSWVVIGKEVADNGKIIITVDLVDQRDFNGKVVWP